VVILAASRETGQSGIGRTLESDARAFGGAPNAHVTSRTGQEVAAIAAQ
jgi:hypothetical protein